MPFAYAQFQVHGLLDYVDGDANNNGYTFGIDYTGWSPIMYMNAGYTLADTAGLGGYSPLTSKNANAYLINSVTVVYDTLWDNDAFLTTSIGFQSAPVPGTVFLDTIWTILGYHNTSGLNDTMILTITGVTAAGFPSIANIYEVDTEVIAPHTHNILPGTSLDSNYEVGFIPKAAGGKLTIPASAHGGWHFGITATVTKGSSKMDTLGIAYYSSFKTCSGNHYADSTTSMGTRNGTITDGSPKYSNSFITGLYWYNAAKPYGGPGGSTTWPIAGGANAGLWYNGNAHFFGSDPAGCSGFISYPYVQNLGILCSVEYNTHEGIEGINATGLSVNQNYPNPFSKTTVINYSLTKSSDVTFTVYDITGRVITSNNMGNVATGQYTINLSANTFSPGIYFYTFNVNGTTVTKKMVVTE